MKPPKVTALATARIRLPYPWPFPIVIVKGVVSRVVQRRAPPIKLTQAPDALF